MEIKFDKNINYKESNSINNNTKSNQNQKFDKKDFSKELFDVLAQNIKNGDAITQENIAPQFHTVFVNEKFSTKETDKLCERLGIDTENKSEEEISYELALALLRDAVFDAVFNDLYFDVKLTYEEQEEVCKQAILLARLDPNALSANQSNLLIVAITFNNIEAYVELRQLGVRLDEINHNNETAFDQLLKSSDEFFLQAIEAECTTKELINDFITAGSSITQASQFELDCKLAFFLAIKNKDIQTFQEAYNRTNLYYFNDDDEQIQDYSGEKNGHAVLKKIKKDLIKHFYKEPETIWMFLCTIEPKLFSVPFLLYYPSRYYSLGINPNALIKNTDFQSFFITSLISKNDFNLKIIEEVIEKLNSLVPYNEKNKVKKIGYDELFNACIENKEALNSLIAKDPNNLTQLIKNLKTADGKDPFGNTEQIFRFLQKTLNFHDVSLNNFTTIIEILITELLALEIDIKKIQAFIVGLIEAKGINGRTLVDLDMYQEQFPKMLEAVISTLLKAEYKLDIKDIQTCIVGLIEAKGKDGYTVEDYSAYNEQFTKMLESVMSTLLKAEYKLDIKDIQAFIVGIIEAKGINGRTLVDLDIYQEQFPKMLKAVISTLLKAEYKLDIKKIQAFIVGIIEAKGINGCTTVDRTEYLEKLPIMLKSFMSILLKADYKLKIEDIQACIVGIIEAKGKDGYTLVDVTPYRKQFPNMLESIISTLLNPEYKLDIKDIQAFIVGIIEAQDKNGDTLIYYRAYREQLPEMIESIISILLNPEYKLNIKDIQACIVRIIEAKDEDGKTIVDDTEYCKQFPKMIELTMSTLLKTDYKLKIEDIQACIVGIIEAKGEDGKTIVDYTEYQEKFTQMLESIISILLNPEYKLNIQKIQAFIGSIIQIKDNKGNTLVDYEDYMKKISIIN